MDMQRIVLVGASLLSVIEAAPGFNPASLGNIANVTYESQSKHINVASLFAPRMDFEQWKPLTGRGDPLRNDPTYDYEPPVLDRVHYWADEPRPERKSEVLMLGVSSRKPSAGHRVPPPPRRQIRPTPIKYEDFTYKLSERYPMTILVPPPPPPPGHKPPLYILTEERLTTPEPIRASERPRPVTASSVEASPSYSLQESSLIFQSSTTTQGSSWVTDFNNSKIHSNTEISSDYAGWGPTTPIDEDPDNEKHNLIFNDNFEITKHPFSFYRPMLSEAPPPPQITPNPLILHTFLPTVLPPTTIGTTTTEPPRTTESKPSTETTTEPYLPETSLNINEELTTPSQILFQPTPPPKTSQMSGMFGMLSSMLSMPMIEPERPEDHLYAYASENLQHVYKDHDKETTVIEAMQTMQPPPPIVTTESTIMVSRRPIHVDPKKINSFLQKPSMNTLDPYLHMRFSTPMPTIADGIVQSFENSITTTEAPTIPSYLIIQGHSKVKTYSSKSRNSEEREVIVNELPKPNETNEVKHLHPIKEKNITKTENSASRNRIGRAKNLKALVDAGLGSIEIQEANIGIKYDISDGSEVPVEVYKKGIVENEVNDYAKIKNKHNRSRRQITLEDLLPFDEEQLEEYVYDFIDGKRNSSSITKIIATALTGEAAEAVDEIEEEIDEER